MNTEPQYLVVAYLPGTLNVAVINSEGVEGHLGAGGTFTPADETFIDSAVIKYGYRRLEKPVSMSLTEAREFQQQSANAR